MAIWRFPYVPDKPVVLATRVPTGRGRNMAGTGKVHPQCRDRRNRRVGRRVRGRVTTCLPAAPPVAVTGARVAGTHAPPISMRTRMEITRTPAISMRACVEFRRMSAVAMRACMEVTDARMVAAHACLPIAGAPVISIRACMEITGMPVRMTGAPMTGTGSGSGAAGRAAAGMGRRPGWAGGQMTAPGTVREVPLERDGAGLPWHCHG